jgi:uncharacterized membrane protein
MYNNIDSTPILASYIIYLLVSLTLTIWVARTLHQHGAIFLIDAFRGNAELAASVNHLLVIGFYLINIGFVSLALKTAAEINTTRAAIELVSVKLGWVMLILGGMHFSNLYLFSRIRRRSAMPVAPPPRIGAEMPSHPPVPPDAVLRPPMAG